MHRILAARSQDKGSVSGPLWDIQEVVMIVFFHDYYFLNSTE